MPSMTQEDGAALLDGGGYPLLCVVGRHDPGESCLLDREPVVDRRIHAAVDRTQGRRDRKRRLAGKLGRQVKRGAKELVRRNNTVDQAEPSSFGRLEDAPTQDQLRRGLPTHVSGQALGAPEGRNDPDVPYGSAFGAGARRACSRPSSTPSLQPAAPRTWFRCS